MPISTQQLMQPTPWRGTVNRYALILAACLLILLLVLFGRSGFVLGWLAVPLLMYFLGYPLVRAMTLNKKILPKVKGEAQAALSTFVGSSPQHIDIDACAGEKAGEITGTGIAYANRTLYILDKGIGAKIPWETVRSWRWELPGHETFHVVGGDFVSDFRLADQLNQQARDRAAGDSGVFVEVADVNRTEWHFRSNDISVLKRWQEILARVKEGAL
jgi:hypothetical protein